MSRTGRTRLTRARITRALSVVLSLAAVAALAVVALVAAPTASAQGQVLNWTADGTVTRYKTAPATAVAGAATIVFENSVATGNTISMPHTLTFDTSTPGYNHDVTLNILANPSDSNGGRHEAQVTLTPGKYRYICTIPGHGQMVGEFTVTTGGGEEDTTAPTVALDVAGEQNADGAYEGGATVTVDAQDAGSGVDTVEYRLDGPDGAGQWQPYTAPIAVTELGEFTVAARASDVAGNDSAETTETFTVVEGDAGDVAPPTVEVGVTGTQNGDGAYLDEATVLVTAEDTGSGVDTIEYALGTGGWQAYTGPIVVSTPGAYTLRARATDNAGNTSAETTETFTVVEGPDVEGPTVTAVVVGEQTANYDYLGRATVRLSATDDKSGVRVIEYALNGAPWRTYTRPVVVEQQGTHTVRYRAYDNEDNASAQLAGSFTIVASDATRGDIDAR